MNPLRKVLRQGWWVVTDLWVDLGFKRKDLLEAADYLGDLALIAVMLWSLMLAVS